MNTGDVGGTLLSSWRPCWSAGSYRILFRGLFPACENEAQKWLWNASVNSV